MSLLFQLISNSPNLPPSTGVLNFSSTHNILVTGSLGIIQVSILGMGSAEAKPIILFPFTSLLFPTHKFKFKEQPLPQKPKTL